MPASFRIRLMVVRLSSWPMLLKTPRIRVKPQVGLSLAIVMTNCSISTAVRGRPGPRLPELSYFWAMSRLCRIRHKRLIAQKYDGSKRRGLGRPRTQKDIADLVIMMANANSRWGYTRIRGAMRNLGHDLGRSTIKRILKDGGIVPAPERGDRTLWKTFLTAHWQALAATAFFTVEVLTLRGLVRYHVLFVIELSTRRIEIAGITMNPTGAWMMQVGRNLTDELDGFLRGNRYLILDRDPVFTDACEKLLGGSGVKLVRLRAHTQ